MAKTGIRRCAGLCTDPTVCFHRTTVEAEQRAGTYSIVLVNVANEIIHSHTYSRDDCADNFLDHLLEMEEDLQLLLAAKEEMVLTSVEERNFRRAETCHICGGPFHYRKGGRAVKVRDHCHLTGIFAGAAHEHCNLLRRVVRRVKLFCHNFSGYDSHILISALAPDPRIKELKCLPRNMEKFRLQSQTHL